MRRLDGLGQAAHRSRTLADGAGGFANRCVGHWRNRMNIRAWTSYPKKDQHVHEPRTATGPWHAPHTVSGWRLSDRLWQCASITVSMGARSVNRGTWAPSLPTDQLGSAHAVRSNQGRSLAKMGSSALRALARRRQGDLANQVALCGSDRVGHRRCRRSLGVTVALSALLDEHVVNGGIAGTSSRHTKSSPGRTRTNPREVLSGFTWDHRARLGETSPFVSARSSPVET